MYQAQYIRSLTETITRAFESQRDPLSLAGQMLAETVRDRHNVFVFGCSHAGILAEEVFYRTGGLAILNPIFFPGFMLNTRPITMTSQLERVEGLGKTILSQNHVEQGDLLILHSVSGRNCVPVEMAMYARELGVKTVCITNLAYSRAVSSRHSSGKRLFEVCDVVIDNCGEVGDAAVAIPGLPEKIGPTSTSVGCALIHAMVIGAVERMLEMGLEPPVFMSANLDGGDEHNARIFDEYGEHIFYM